MGVTIRQATVDDIETLFDIRTSVAENHQSRKELAAEGVTPEALAELLKADARAWIAEVDGVPAAFSMAKGDEATVFAMFVRPEFGGRGLGRLLMDQAEDFLFARHDLIWLNTSEAQDIRAHGFYRKRGWVAVGTAARHNIRYEKRRNSPRDATVKKGYWMAMLDVTDEANYPKYIAANKAAFDKYGARFLVRGGKGEVLEGPAASRLVVIEFDSYRTALDCFHSPEYQAALKLRQQYAKAHFAIVEGA